MNLSESISSFYHKGLEQLKHELQAYPDTEVIWKVAPGTTNSAGTLFLHLIGNLQHFVIKGLANTDFVRDRESEFSTKDTPKEEILEDLNTLEKELRSALELLKDEDLLNTFPIAWRDGKMLSTHFMLIQMNIHLTYHLGQINYHRRFFTLNS